MKRGLSLILALMVSCSMLLSGCGGSSPAPASSAPAPASSTAVSAPADAASGEADHTQGDPVTIKIAHVSADGVPIDEFCDKLVEDFDNLTGGRITVQVFPASQMGNNSELLEQLQFGTLEMCISSVAFLGAFTDTTTLLDLPYLFKNEAAAEEVLDGEVGQSMFADLENSGFHGLAWLSTGWRHLTANKEIHKPADLAGLKIRVMENQMHIAHFNALGASAVPMAFSELYTALQNGTMDCQENPWANIDGNRLYEVQKYIIETGHIYDTSPLLASKSWWDTLSASDQELITQVITEGLAWERELSASNQDELREKIGSNGTNQVIQLTDEERQAFRDAAQPVYDEYGAPIQDLIDTVEAVNAKY
ncbi:MULTISPECIES: TRAP transporter substrate-binding protein [Anaerotruncus]|uniref:TRAP transporter substrate-binding protein n=2 Tax=Oscillospiraceae TaxID=216572 RepID=UPI000E4A4F70|nr:MULTISPECIES: TRAP transporter substrate-binding protein [Anaerotruncus]RGX55176.1 TRAP transporter substrate-binding protein DctP [Anaerotruncus sp. AF02-27]